MHTFAQKERTAQGSSVGGAYQNKFAQDFQRRTSGRMNKKAARRLLSARKRVKFSSERKFSFDERRDRAAVPIV
jgi:hypothetical protein